MNTAQRVTLVLMLIVIVSAVAFALLPLPKQTLEGNPATCGPGSSSASAVYVKLNPRSVVGHVPNTDTARALAQRFEDQCQGVADDRLVQVTVVAVAAAVIGALALAIFGAPATRRESPPEHR